MKRLKILFLTARFPFPVIGGDRLKPFNILRHLGKKHDVTLLSYYWNGNADQQHLDAVRNLGVNVVTVPIKPFNAGIVCATRLLGKLPLEISFYTQPAFKKAISKLTNENDFDFAIAFFMRTSEYIKNAPFKKLLMAEDCRTLYQKRSYEQSKNLKQRLVRFYEYMQLKRYEPQIVEHFDVTTLVTKEDIEAMNLQNSNASYQLLTNGVDLDVFTPPNSFDLRKDIIFAGKLDVWANVLMLQQLVNEIFPIILKELPNTRLKIVGANPTKEVKNLLNENIELIENVPDMLPYLQNARVFLHPHNGGSGIQNKLLEAMACQCPIVTTPTGNQGIHAVHKKQAMLGLSSKELARHTIEVLTNDNLAKTLGENARELIAETHSWDIVFEQIDNIIEELFDEKQIKQSSLL